MRKIKTDTGNIQTIRKRKRERNVENKGRIDT